MIPLNTVYNAQIIGTLPGNFFQFSQIETDAKGDSVVIGGTYNGNQAIALLNMNNAVLRSQWMNAYNINNLQPLFLSCLAFNEVP